MLYRTILCATDGLEHSDRALTRAATMAGEQKAELHVVHIAERPSGMASRGSERAAEQEMPGGERVQRIRGQISELSAGDPDLSVIPHFVASAKGSVATQIATLGDRIDADLIIVGSRGRGRLGGAIAGSTVQRLPHESKRPVLVLAGTAAARTDADRSSTLESVRHALHV